MFKNYATTAFRNLISHKLYSIINIAGLAIGLAACILILLFVRDETSYDQWLPNAERIAMLEITFYPPGREPLEFAQTPGPAKAALEAGFGSDIEHVVRIYQNNQPVRTGDRQFNDTISYVDPAFFEVLDLPMAEGSREAALANNLSIVLSQTMAKKYFGDIPAVGKTLTIDNKWDYTVVGILRDLPINTSLDIDMLALFDTQRYVDQPWVAEQWFSANVSTLILFSSPEAMAIVESELGPFIDENISQEIPGLDGKMSDIVKFNFMPFLDIHLFAKIPGYFKPGGDIVAVLTFSAVAVLILLIACINFMNLATARSMQRAREVSMRKVLGATRQQLIWQFLSEALLMAVAALVIAVAVAELALEPYNAFLGKEMSLDFLTDPVLAGTVAGLILIVGLVGGSYPAFYLSSFRPARVLKSNQSGAGGSVTIRNILVVFQFAISIALIISTAVVYGQTLYARNMDPGFEKTDKIVLKGLNDMQNPGAKETLKARLATLPGVRAVSMSSDTPPQRNMNNSMIFPRPNQNEQGQLIENLNVDADFFQVYGIEPVAGRLFSEDFPTDYRIEPEDENEQATEAIVVNESFLGKFGFASAEEAVGQAVWDSVNQHGRLARATIIGVVPDLHLRSVRFNITPMLYLVRKADSGFMRYLTIDVAPGRMQEVLRGAEDIWKDMAPDVTIRTSFIDEDIAALYDAEEERGLMFAGFALFAVLVACLGLYGLASFAAEKRTKEIGIRKVMGASALDIIRMMVWQFSKPVLLANLIAWPVAGYLMGQWLQNFQYRIDLISNAYLFVVAGLVALVIAWITVGGHAARVARSNPINALRYE